MYVCQSQSPNSSHHPFPTLVSIRLFSVSLLLLVNETIYTNFFRFRMWFWVLLEGFNFLQCPSQISQILKLIFLYTLYVLHSHFPTDYQFIFLTKLLLSENCILDPVPGTWDTMKTNKLCRRWERDFKQMHVTSIEQFWWGWEYSLDMKIVDCLYSSPTSFDTNRSFHYFVGSECISLSSSALCVHMSS